MVPSMAYIGPPLDIYDRLVIRANKDLKSYGRTTVIFEEDELCVIDLFIALYLERGYDVQRDDQFGLTRVHIE
jgi:hypothetical protein